MLLTFGRCRPSQTQVQRTGLAKKAATVEPPPWSGPEDAWLDALYQEAACAQSSALAEPATDKFARRVAGRFPGANPESDNCLPLLFEGPGRALTVNPINEAREALAHVAAVGMRAEEAVMAKKGNIPPMSAAYQALRERTFRRKEAAMLKEVERLLVDHATSQAKMLNDGHQVIETQRAQLRKALAAVPAFRAAAKSWQASAKQLREQICSAEDKADSLAEQLRVRDGERLQAVAEGTAQRERAALLGQQLDESIARSQALSRELMQEKERHLAAQTQISELRAAGKRPKSLESVLHSRVTDACRYQ